MQDEALLRISNLRAGFGSAEAVRGVSFDISRGEVVCLVGQSGSGKSLTALSVLRLLEFEDGASAGDVRFEAGEDSVDLMQADPRVLQRLRGAGIGIVFQDPLSALNPVLTIGRQMTEGLRAHMGLSWSEARARAVGLLREVQLPDADRLMRAYPHQLSGGMRQRVAIAMALACDPKLLIADEPTTALDVTTQADILALLDRLRRDRDMAVLFITHDMGVVAQMADRVVVMDEGQVVEQGAVGQVFAAPKAEPTKTLLAATPRLGVSFSPAAEPPIAEPLLQVKNLSVSYAGKAAVRDVSFDIAPWETLTLVGESGSGKTSVGRAILRLITAQAGQVYLGDRDLLSLKGEALRQARRDVQMVFQDPTSSFDPKRMIGDQLIDPMKNYGIGTAADRPDRVRGLCEDVALSSDLLSRYPHTLSGGQIQRAAIARALATGPKLIVADEAVSALDTLAKARIMNLMKDLQTRLGLSYLFISHDMAVVDQISHRVAVMRAGRIVEIGPREAVLRHPQHAYTKALLAAVPVPDPALPRTAPMPLPPDIEECHYEDAGPGHKVLVST